MSVVDYYKILPKKYVEESKRRTEYDNYAKLGIEIPFTMIIVGSKGSGKTNAFANIRDTFQCFTRFYLVAPTLTQPIYRQMIESLEEARKKLKLTDPIITAVEKLEELPPLDTFDKEENNLLITDDLSAENVQSLERFFTNCRHFNTSCIHIAHDYFRIPIMMRKNADLLVLTSGIVSERDLTRILSEFSHPIPIEDVIKLYKACTRNQTNSKINFFVLDNRSLDDERKYRKNMTLIRYKP